MTQIRESKDDVWKDDFSNNEGEFPDEKEGKIVAKRANMWRRADAIESEAIALEARALRLRQKAVNIRARAKVAQ